MSYRKGYIRTSRDWRWRNKPHSDTVDTIWLWVWRQDDRLYGEFKIVFYDHSLSGCGTPARLEVFGDAWGAFAAIAPQLIPLMAANPGPSPDTVEDWVRSIGFANITEAEKGKLEVGGSEDGQGGDN